MIEKFMQFEKIIIFLLMVMMALVLFLSTLDLNKKNYYILAIYSS
jgi:hypothetical protein